MVTVMAIAIGVVVLVIPIVAAATTNAFIQMRRCRRQVWAPVAGIIVDDDAVVGHDRCSGSTAAPAVGRDGPNSRGDDKDSQWSDGGGGGGV